MGFSSDVSTFFSDVRIFIEFINQFLKQQNTFCSWYIALSIVLPFLLSFFYLPSFLPSELVGKPRVVVVHGHDNEREPQGAQIIYENAQEGVTIDLENSPMWMGIVNWDRQWQRCNLFPHTRKLRISDMLKTKRNLKFRYWFQSLRN